MLDVKSMQSKMHGSDLRQPPFSLPAIATVARLAVELAEWVV